jgi:HPt (histidine-containing phosphotransfer) domain-containing protein
MITAGTGAAPDAFVAEQSTLPSVDGLNSADGLRRVGGNNRLYVNLLRQFAGQQRHAIGQIRAALATNDVETAIRMAHTLKGVAGSLGAMGVQDAAAAVETLLRNDSAAEATNQSLVQLAVVLEPLLAGLHAAFATSAAAPSAAPAVAAAVTRTVAAQLTKLFADFDTSAVTFVEENQANLRPAFDIATWEQFLRHTQEFAFADAQALLDQALKNLPKS